MPAKTLILPQKVQKSANKLPRHIQKHLPKALLSIKQNPFIGIKLHGELAGYYKYRIGDYRLVYRFNTKTSTVEVVKIEHRQGVYK
jgi:mRNA interferase RelE/StbE